jgi:hypothetical protein
MAGYCTSGLYMAPFIACVMCGDIRDALNSSLRWTSCAVARTSVDLPTPLCSYSLEV